MRLLVPLPFDISCLRHGRNLRIVNLLRQLVADMRITCAAANERIAASAVTVLPNIEILTAPSRVEPQAARAARLRGPWLLRRAAEFFGYDPAFHAWIDRLSGNVDVVLGFDLVSAMYLAQLGELSGRGVPTLCDVIDDPWLTYRSGTTAGQLSGTGLRTGVAVQVMRRLLLPQMSRLVAVAPRDAESLGVASHRPVQVIPNGVDLPVDIPKFTERETLVVLTGAMGFPPNEQAACWLAQSVWPRVRALVPSARLALVGADPSRRVQTLAQLSGVSVTGRVPSVSDWLQRARVATAPMRSGTGIKNKILEAWANGCPVVATSLAADGLPGSEADGMLVADDAGLFAAHLIRLLADAEEASCIGQAGRATVRTRFTWAGVSAVMHAAIVDCSRDLPQRHNYDIQAGPSIDKHRPALPLGKEAEIHAVS